MAKNTHGDTPANNSLGLARENQGCACSLELPQPRCPVHSPAGVPSGPSEDPLYWSKRLINLAEGLNMSGFRKPIALEDFLV